MPGFFVIYNCLFLKIYSQQNFNAMLKGINFYGLVIALMLIEWAYYSAPVKWWHFLIILLIQWIHLGLVKVWRVMKMDETVTDVIKEIKLNRERKNMIKQYKKDVENG